MHSWIHRALVGRFLVFAAGIGLMAAVTQAQTAALVANSPTYALGGGELTLTATISYSGVAAPFALGYTIVLPDGWTLVATRGTNVPAVVPEPGTADVLEFAYVNAIPVGAASFTVVVAYPAGLSGAQRIAASVLYRAPLATLTIPSLTLSPAAGPPAITVQPLGQTATAGNGVSFSVTAGGVAPLTYQWRKDGVVIAGAVSATLLLANVQSGDAGSYTCVVSNSQGSVTSTAALLTVTALPQPPKVVTPPLAQTVKVGATVELAVVASGTTPLSYQWLKDGAPLGGATAATLQLANIQTSAAAGYAVRIANSVGSVVSNVVRLTVEPVAVRPQINLQPVSQSAVAGAALTLSVGATGGSALSYQWRKDGGVVVGATQAVLTVAEMQPSDAGTYTVEVSDAAGSVLSAAATVTVTIPNPGRLINLSVLTTLAAGETMTVGTVLGGSGTGGLKALVARAAGPALGQLGVKGVLPDPALTLTYTSTSPAIAVATNNDWAGNSALATAFTQVGAFAYASPASKDAGLYQPALIAGNYTVQIRDADGSAGVVIAELYDATPPGAFTLKTPRLVNVSVLKNVGGGETVTLGFVLGGATNRSVLIRAVGPTLGSAPFNVAGSMADPKLELFKGQAVIQANDDWAGGAELTAAFQGVGAFSLAGAASKDAALLVALSPGAYTAQVSGAAAGLVLLEIYEIP